ncbi:MAG TPA: hybrid sensor histidine kinase/response regulator [Ktedonobacteraceae bacterium]
MDTPHILIVDDDSALLEALPHMVALHIHGVHVDISDSAFKALDQIQKHDYDAIVSDIKMPGMDGLELLAKIQELRPEIPTLLITGHADQDLITQALRGGAYDFIQKPIDRVYFVAALHRAIQAHQLHRQVREQQEALKQLVEQRTHELETTNEAMDALVRDLLDYALILSGEFTLHPTRCNLIELCQQVLMAYTKGAGLEPALECDLEPIEGYVDHERMNQVLVHLLSNARMYSPAGTPITVALNRSEDEVTISIHDVGSGVQAERLPHIFEQFSGMSEMEMETNIRRGAGLGLYLSRYIVEQHGGRIEVKSTPGEGNIFSVILPLAPDGTGKSTKREQANEHEPALFQPPRWLIS